MEKVEDRELQTIEHMVRLIKSQMDGLEMSFRAWTANAQQIIFTLEHNNDRLRKENEALKEKINGNDR